MPIVNSECLIENECVSIIYVLPLALLILSTHVLLLLVGGGQLTAGARQKDNAPEPNISKYNLSLICSIALFRSVP